MEPRFGILREALTQNQLGRRRAAPSLGRRRRDGRARTRPRHRLGITPAHQSERAGIVLSPELTAGVAALHASIDAPPGDTLWDPASLDSHPTWIAARRAAAHLLRLLPDDDTPRGAESL